MNRRHSHSCELPDVMRRLPETLPTLVRLWRIGLLAKETMRELPEVFTAWQPCLSSIASGVEIEWLVVAGFLQLCPNSCSNRPLDQPADNLSPSLTPLGLSLIERLADAFGGEMGALLDPRLSRRQAIPEWDAHTRELCFRGQVVKRFRKSAPNQEQILNLFEQNRWPRRIAVPFPCDSRVPPLQRLRDTVKCLNRNMNTPLLRFGGDGRGAGVCWHIQNS